MIVQRSEIPQEIICKLDVLLTTWAFYRVREPMRGRRVHSEYWELRRRVGSEPLEVISTFELHQLPGCAGIGMSVHANVSAMWRNKGVGAALLQFREYRAAQLGYRFLLCTVRHDNIAERIVLFNAGFQTLQVSEKVQLKGKPLS